MKIYLSGELSAKWRTKFKEFDHFDFAEKLLLDDFNKVRWTHEAIKNCDIVVAVLGKEAHYHIANEIYIAHAYNKQVYLVDLIKGRFLNHVTYFDSIDDVKRVLRQKIDYEKNSDWGYIRQ